MKLAILGFGEAGQAIAQGLQGESAGPDLACFDIKTLDPAQAKAITAAADKMNVANSPNLEEALNGAEFVFSTVTAGSAMDVAKAVARVRPDLQAYFDMNSVAPSTKAQEARVLEGVGIAYIDTAIMAPIYPKLHKTPTLLAGTTAQRQAEVLTAWGMDVRVVGQDVGRASSIKMLRSVMIKGLEALTAEMGLAAEKAGVTDEVIASLNTSFPGTDWEERTAYNLERMTTHGIRRAEEMEEVVKTLEDLGINPELTSGTVRRQRRFGQGSLNLNDTNPSLPDYARKIFAEFDEI